jgi:hypothetical protein
MSLSNKVEMSSCKVKSPLDDAKPGPGSGVKSLLTFRLVALREAHALPRCRRLELTPTLDALRALRPNSFDHDQPAAHPTVVLAKGGECSKASVDGVWFYSVWHLPTLRLYATLLRVWLLVVGD